MALFVFSSGCILRLPIWGDPADDNCFDDEPYWEVRNETIKMLVTTKKSGYTESQISHSTKFVVQN